jgi:nitrilase
VYVIGCCMALRRDDIPDRFEFKAMYDAGKTWINPGDSVIVAPGGAFAGGPAHGEETILYAQIDPALIGGARWILDVAGHYARPDVFSLAVDRGPHPMIHWAERKKEAPQKKPPRRRDQKKKTS